MTLENCKRLLAHFEKIGDKENAAVFRERVARKSAKMGVADAKKPKG